jgi:hypothetical protein
VTAVRLDVAHSSGQFSDTQPQQTADAKRLAARAEKRGWRWLTGTEAGPQSVLGKALATVDQDHGLRFRKGRAGDVWVCHRRDLFEGPVEEEWYKVVDGVAGRFADRGVLRVTGHSPLVQSDLTVLVSHYLTEGRPGGDAAHRRFLRDNTRIAAKVGEVGREFGRGTDLCFYGGDQNIPDREFDTFLGAPFTSLADELGDWQDTGHGSIDVIASYNGDGRVRGASFDVLDDSEFALASDHFLCEGSFEVRAPRHRRR